MIDKILPIKQSFIGTVEAVTELRIMQWNLTGLRGATRAEELINVWGPAGVVCGFFWSALSSHLVGLSFQKKPRASVLLNSTSPEHQTPRRCSGGKNESRRWFCTCSFNALRALTVAVRREASTVIQPACPRLIPLLSPHVHNRLLNCLMMLQRKAAWVAPSCPLPSPLAVDCYAATL